MGVVVTSNSGKVITPAPAGVAPGVCCDVIDLGMVTEEYDGKKRSSHKVVLVWQIDEINPETGKRFTVGKRYTASLHEKATLRKDLQSWRGRAFTNEELAGFDLDHVLNVCALLNVVHNNKDGKTYANVEAVMPLPKGSQKLLVHEYVRVQDRKDAPTPNEQEDDSNIPF